jgi:hypothetical protein
MKALQALSGGGGWPMSVWLTPEGKPFFAGTYFQKYRFQQILRRIAEVWKSDRSALMTDSEHLLRLAQNEESEEEASTEAERREFLEHYITHFHHVFDDQYGGFGQAPKFPQTMNLMLMMRQDFKTGMRHAEILVNTTLLNMVRGGVYDQLRGGFHRYSVDREWLIPHFEKMLYDQALISVTLLEAYQLYGEPELARAARETAEYVLREMTSPDGGFYSAQDADSFNPEKNEKEEGYFATYSYAELKTALSAAELQELARVYGVREGGQFEGRNILHLQDGVDGTAKEDPTLRSALMKLEKLRGARPAPHLDDKIIVAWNGWMIWALARLGRGLKEPRFTAAAEKATTFVKHKLWSEGRLKRFWREGAAIGAGTAEDYSAMILAGLELKGQESWLRELQDVLDRDFWDEKNGGYFTSDGRDPHLPARSKDDYDGVHPSAGSMSAWNLLHFYELCGEPRFLDRAEKLITLLYPRLKQYPSALPFLGLAVDYLLSEPSVIVVSNDNWAKEFAHAQESRFHPYAFWLEQPSQWPVAANKKSGVSVCRRGICLKPASAPEEAQTLLAYEKKQ